MVLLFRPVPQKLIPLPPPPRSFLTGRKLHLLNFDCRLVVVVIYHCCLPEQLLRLQQLVLPEVIAGRCLRPRQQGVGLKGLVVEGEQLHSRQSKPRYYSGKDSSNILGYQFSLCIVLLVQVSPNLHRKYDEYIYVDSSYFLFQP